MNSVDNIICAIVLVLVGSLVGSMGYVLHRMVLKDVQACTIKMLALERPAEEIKELCK